MHQIPNTDGPGKLTQFVIAVAVVVSPLELLQCF